MTGRPYRPRGPILPMAAPTRGLVAWCRRHARWLPLWAALAGFGLFASIELAGRL